MSSHRSYVLTNYQKKTKFYWRALRAKTVKAVMVMVIMMVSESESKAQENGILCETLLQVGKQCHWHERNRQDDWGFKYEALKAHIMSRNHLNRVAWLREEDGCCFGRLILSKLIPIPLDPDGFVSGCWAKGVWVRSSNFLLFATLLRNWLFIQKEQWLKTSKTAIKRWPNFWGFRTR